MTKSVGFEGWRAAHDEPPREPPAKKEERDAKDERPLGKQIRFAACIHCGKEKLRIAVACPHCGRQQSMLRPHGGKHYDIVLWR